MGGESLIETRREGKSPLSETNISRQNGMYTGKRENLISDTNLMVSLILEAECEAEKRNTKK